MCAINYLHVGERGREHPSSSSEGAAVLKVEGGSGGCLDTLSSFVLFFIIYLIFSVLAPV